MRWKQWAAALTAVFVLVAAVVVLGDAFGNTPATADTSTVSATDDTDGVDDTDDSEDMDGEFEDEQDDDRDDDQDDDAYESDEDEEEGAHLAGEAALSAEEAIAIAGNEVDGAAGEVELEREGGRLLYEISFDNGYEVEVDANTGEVVEIEQDDD